MESVSAILRDTMASPNEATRPAATTCACGATLEPVWCPFPRPHWSTMTVCDECAARARQGQRDRELREAACAKAVSRLRLSPLAERMTLDAYRPVTSSQEAALAAVASGTSVWLHGAPGVGKTHLATAAALQAASTGEHVERWLVSEFAASVRADAMGDGAEVTIRALKAAALVVLDDIGAERPTPIVVESLHRIIDYRYERGTRVIVTSNAAPSVVARAIGARVHSRLLGMCKVVHMTGPDSRLTR